MPGNDAAIVKRTTHKRVNLSLRSNARPATRAASRNALDGTRVTGSARARAWVRRVSRWGGASLLVACAGLSACRVRDASRDAAPVRSASAPARSSSAQPAAEPKESSAPSADRSEVSFGAGRARFFVPPERSAGARLPLLVLLHGLGGSGSQIAADLGLDAFASQKGFAYVAPDGTLDPMGRRFWNAGSTCCNFFAAPVDDVARIRALIEHGARELFLDPARVSIVGYSNGGFMAHRLACELGEKVASIVSIAAAGPHDACAAGAPVSVLEIHGDRDPVVPFAGGPLFGRAELPRVKDLVSSLAPWRSANGCTGEFRRQARLDLVADIAGAETDVLRPTQCAMAPVELWAVRGGSHYLALGKPAVEKIWDFIAKQARPPR